MANNPNLIGGGMMRRMSQSEMSGDRRKFEYKKLDNKALLRRLREENPNVEKSVFNAIHTVNLDTFPGWKTKGENHSFLEWYE